MIAAKSYEFQRKIAVNTLTHLLQQQSILVWNLRQLAVVIIFHNNVVVAQKFMSIFFQNWYKQFWNSFQRVAFRRYVLTCCFINFGHQHARFLSVYNVGDFLRLQSNVKCMQCMTFHRRWQSNQRFHTWTALFSAHFTNLQQSHNVTVRREAGSWCQPSDFNFCST